MKQAGSFLILCALLILSLTACGTKSTGANSVAGSGTSVTDSAKARAHAMMDEGKQMVLDAKYYAAPNGRVRGMGKGSLMNDMHSAADKVAKGIRQTGDAIAKAPGDTN